MESPLTIKNSLQKLIQQDCIQVVEPLSNHTYTKTGGSADILVSPKSIQEVEKVSQFAFKHKIPITILGHGSNVIVSDKGIRGITILMVHLKDVKIEGNTLTVGSGASLIEVAKNSPIPRIIRT